VSNALVGSRPYGPAEKRVPIKAFAMALGSRLVVGGPDVQTPSSKQEVVGGYDAEEGSEYRSQEQHERLM
jgi:hypothetical protein